MQKHVYVRGARHPPVLTITLLIVMGALAFFITRVGIPSPNGVWKDVDSDFYIVFDEVSGTYRESEFNMSRPYKVTASSVVFTGVNGGQTVTPLVRNFYSHALVTVNGKSHVMFPYDSGVPKLSTWGIRPAAEKCLAVYAAKQSFGETLLIRLFEGGDYVFLGGGEDGSEVIGKYFIDSDNSLLLFDSADSTAEVLKAWALGYAMGRLDSSLSAQVVKANAIEDRGILLRGYVRLPEAGVTYDFYDSNRATRTMTNGDVIEMLYFVDTNGLVTMTDTVGSNLKDYMWYDQESNAMYRYVFEKDNWYEYLEEVSGA